MASRIPLRFRERALVLLPLCASLFQLVACHSWVGCTDYRGPVDFYDESKCHGYPRLFEEKRGAAALTPLSTGYQLGADTGYNFRASATQPCPWPVTSPIDASYTRNYPKATYEQGGLYCLAWPTKNHVAAPCTNQYIPDTGLSLLRSNINPTPATEATQSEFNSNPVLTYFGTHATGVIDCLGFQRSPQFCTNTDKALGTGCFRVPANLAVGVYSYQWHWEFNTGEVYSSCWDASVVAPGTGTGVGGVQYDPNTLTDTISSGSVCRTNWATVTGTPPPATSPTVTLSVSPSATSNAVPKTFTAVWSEAVTGFVQGDVTVSGGTIGNFKFTSPATYTWDVTPSAASVLVSSSIPAGVCTNSAGSGNTASATVSTQHDAQKPSVVLSSSTTSISSTATFTATATFSEAVTGVTLSDFGLLGGTVSNLNAVSATVYTVTVAPAYTTSPQSRNTSISMGSNMAQDTANNQNTAASTLVIPHGADTQKPSVVLSASTTSISSVNPFTATASFSEAVTGVTLADFVVTGGTAATVVAVSTSVYTVTVTPTYTTSPPSTSTSIAMAASAAKDAANNPSTAATTLVIPHSINSGCLPQSFAAYSNWTVLVANDFVHRGGGSVDGGVAAGKNVWPNGGGAQYGSVMAGEQFLIQTQWGGSTATRPKAATFRKVSTDWWAIGGTAVGTAVDTTSSVSYIDFQATAWKNTISTAIADYTAVNSFLCGVSGARQVVAVGSNANKASCFELTNWGGLYVHGATASGQQCHTTGVNLFSISASQLANLQSISITSNQVGVHSTVINVVMDVSTLTLAGGWGLFGQATANNVLLNMCGSSGSNGQLNLGRISSTGGCAGGTSITASLLAPQLSVSSAPGCAQLRGQLVAAAFDGATQFVSAPFAQPLC